MAAYKHEESRRAAGVLSLMLDAMQVRHQPGGDEMNT